MPKHAPFYLTVILENIYTFYNTALDIFGIIFFYHFFGQKILPAFLVIAANYFLHGLLAAPVMQLIGKVGSRNSLFVSTGLLSLSSIPLCLFVTNPQPLYVLAWYLAVILGQTFYYSTKVFLLSRYSTYQNRGRQFAFKTITLMVTATFSPLLSGLVIANTNFPVLIILANFILLFSVVPALKLPDSHFSVDLRLAFHHIKNNARTLTGINAVALLSDSGVNQLWIIFLFLNLRSSYQHLGWLITLTTASTFILTYFIGRYLDTGVRFRALRFFYIITAISDASKSLPWIPLSLRDGLGRLIKSLRGQTSEVVNYDLMSQGVPPQYRDEMIVVRETGVNLTEAFSIALTGCLAKFLGFQNTFLALAMVIFILTVIFNKQLSESHPV